MKVGALGKVPFKVSGGKDHKYPYKDKGIVQTFTSFSTSGSAEYSTHKPQLKTPIPEFTGRNLKEASMEILLSRYLGCDKPITLHNVLQKYMREGTPVTLTTGTYTWGYKWVITSLQMTAEYYDRQGKIDQIRVTVSLMEYPRPAGVKKKNTKAKKTASSKGKKTTASPSKKSSGKLTKAQLAALKKSIKGGTSK